MPRSSSSKANSHSPLRFSQSGRANCGRGYSGRGGVVGSLGGFIGEQRVQATRVPAWQGGRVARPLPWEGARRRMYGSFWGGGFDSITPLARLGDREHRLDLVEATEHDRKADEDYGLMARLGIKWAREDIRSYRCEEAPGSYSFDHLEPIAQAARRHGIDVVWSWMHYGCPTFVNPLDETFPDQLVAVGERFLAWLREREMSARAVAPINELSYYTWRVGTLGSWHPFARGP